MEVTQFWPIRCNMKSAGNKEFLADKKKKRKQDLQEETVPFYYKTLPKSVRMEHLEVM